MAKRNEPSPSMLPEKKPLSALDKFKTAIGLFWGDNTAFVQLAPQTQTFQEVTDTTAVDIHSQVEKQIYQTASANGYFTSQLAYRNFVYGNTFTNKPWRLASYRVVANSPEVSLAIDELADAMLNENEKGEVFEFSIRRPGLTSWQQKTLNDEAKAMLNMFRFNTAKGFEYCRRFFVEGELAWENIIDPEHKEKGILGVRFIEPESYEYVVDINNNVIGFVFNAMIQLNKTLSPQFQNYFNSNPYFAGQVNGQIDFSPYAGGTESKILAMPVHMLTWIRDESALNNNKTMILPHVARCQQIWRRLLLLKDSLIIYRLVRAPMCRVFNVNVGGVQGNKAAAELQRFANAQKNRRVFNPQTGDVDSDYDVHALTHNIFFAMDKDGKGSTVENLEGGSPEFLKDLDDVKLVLRELYKALKVPFDRWENPANDSPWYMNDKITYEESSFYKFVMRQQNMFSSAIKETFITHLKMIGVWEKFELSEDDIDFNMVKPPVYFAYILKQSWISKLEIYKETTGDEEMRLFDPGEVAKQYLNVTEEELEQHRIKREERMIHDAFLKRKLANIDDHGSVEDVGNEVQGA